ncbi:hypothetical protein GWI33_008182 [Rhynchophorus ferrugineus]|uniref:Uncharacterized protein n=1 Tax=Rhynchophorus ferrugineus TaxID=354439 RepID=A0A834ICB3_RHYFE|nr:hypothetical protein GWI33_008182 [Rhynchophorus ferrugineus]
MARNSIRATLYPLEDGAVPAAKQKVGRENLKPSACRVRRVGKIAEMTGHYFRAGSEIATRRQCRRGASPPLCAPYLSLLTRVSSEVAVYSIDL